MGDGSVGFLSNLGPTEIVVIAIVAVLVFGKNLPQAASKALAQARKLRGALEDLRRETGIDRELRNIERSVREAEWEARRPVPSAPPPAAPALPPPAETAPPPEPPTAAGESGT
jgi:Sec-independent protein translocase protein TatA